MAGTAAPCVRYPLASASALVGTAMHNMTIWNDSGIFRICATAGRAASSSGIARQWIMHAKDAPIAMLSNKDCLIFIYVPLQKLTPRGDNFVLLMQ